MRIRVLFLCLSICLSPACGVAQEEDASGKLRERFAVVIGISDYEDDTIADLKYAHRDAEEFYKFILTQDGFKKENIKLLTSGKRTINRPDAEVLDATTGEIRWVLRDWLKGVAGPEDDVLIFISCHGAPDPVRGNVVYFLTQNTDMSKIGSTGFPMSELNRILDDRIIAANKVTILADTCHSGAVALDGAKASMAVAPQAVTLLNELKKIEGRHISAMFSSEADAKSYERKFNDEDTNLKVGQGVFTHFLIKGMRGAADTDAEKGVIRFGELYDYVRTKVVEATKTDESGKERAPQTPYKSPGSLNSYPMSVTDEKAALKRLDVGQRLYELGMDLHEDKLLESAADHLRIAAELFARRSMPDLRMKSLFIQGQARLALNQFGDARDLFAKIGEMTELATDKRSQALLYLGIAHVKLGDTQSAIRALEKFIETEPVEDETRWARELLDSLNTEPVGKYALLIGIDRPRSQGASGPIRQNDVSSLARMLIDKYGFRLEDTVRLPPGASKRQITQAFEIVRKKCKRGDSVFVYLAGDATKNDSLVVNYDMDDHATEELSSEFFADQIASIPTHKWLFLDINHIPSLANRLSKAKDVDVFWACSPGQVAMEDHWNGAFTSALLATLNARYGPRTNGQLFNALKRAITSLEQSTAVRAPGHSASDGARVDGLIQTPLVSESFPGQVPVFQGDEGRPFIEKATPMMVFDLNQGRRFHDPHQLFDTHRHYAAGPHYGRLAKIHFHLGDAMLKNAAGLERGARDRALKNALASMHHYADHRGDEQLDLKTHLTLARAELLNRNYARFIEMISRRGLFEVDDEDKSLATLAREQESRAVEVAKLAGVLAQRHALLVGVSKYRNGNIQPLASVPANVRAMASVLRERFGVTHIKILEDEQADRESILREFNKLAETSRQFPCLFYYSGYGSLDEDWRRTILSYDARSDSVEDIALDDLKANEDTALTTIIDAGWASTLKFKMEGWGRFLYPTRDLAPAVDDTQARIGRHTLIAPFRSDGLTERLTKALGAEGSAASLRELAVTTDAELRSAGAVERLLSGRTSENQVDQLVNKILAADVRKTIARLKEIGQSDSLERASSLIDIGVAANSIRDHKLSTESLDEAIRVLEGLGGPRDLLSFAKYYHGRALYDEFVAVGSRHGRGDLSLAVARLKEAGAGRRPQVSLYLGRALTALMDRNLARDAQSAFDDYIRRGAPEGARSEAIANRRRHFLVDRSREFTRRQFDPAGMRPRSATRRPAQRKVASPIPSSNAAAGFASKKWPNGSVLRVFFFGSDDPDHTVRKRRIAQIAAEWSKHCNIQFDFSPEIERMKSHLRIGFVEADGTWSYVGRAANDPSLSQTMNLSIRDHGADEFKQYVLRAFGHSLGLIKENQQPGALAWRKDFVLNWYRVHYGWDREIVQVNLFERYPDGWYGIDKPFDRNSIMGYYYPGFMFTDGVAYTPGYDLSDGDKRFIGKLYPRLQANGEFLSSELTPYMEINKHIFTVAQPGSYVIETKGNTAIKLLLERTSEPGKPLGKKEDVDLTNDRIRATLPGGEYAVTVMHRQGGSGKYEIRTRKAMPR